MLSIVVIVFVSAFIRSALGFGDAVVAMPLLAMTVGLKTASPLVAFMSPTISLMILAGNWRRIELRSAGAAHRRLASGHPRRDLRPGPRARGAAQGPARAPHPSLRGLRLGQAEGPDQERKAVAALVRRLDRGSPRRRVQHQRAAGRRLRDAQGLAAGGFPGDPVGIFPADGADGPRRSRPRGAVDGRGDVVLSVVPAGHRPRRRPRGPAEQADPPHPLRRARSTAVSPRWEPCSSSAP